MAYRAGSRHPLDWGAAGQAILAGRNGHSGSRWVVTSGELQEGAHGIASPLPSGTGIEASVGVVSLATLDPATAGPRVAATAEQIGRALS